MAQTPQIIADWMARLHHSRDVKRESSSMVSRKNILTVISSCGTHKTTASGFLRHYPALMDPRKLLQLIAKYATKDIVFWANNGRKLPVVSAHNINELRIRAIKLMGKRTPGGKDTLTRIIDIVKSHNRIDDHKHNIAQIRPEVVFMSLNAWYACISQSSTSDSKLPLYFINATDGQKALTLLLGTQGTQRLSLILSELLHDPLFPHCNLQDIPDHVLLEWCASHSYRHVLDKMKVNNPCVESTHENIKIRVESLIHPPASTAPADAVDSTAEDDDTKSINSESSLFMEDGDMEDDTMQEIAPVVEYFQRCGCCLDNGLADCKVNSDPRQPGQICTRCQSLGEFCEDRLPTERLGSSAQKALEQEYRRRLKYDGHVRERAGENHRLHMSPKTFAVRAQLYLSLLDEYSGRHKSLAQTSLLCLPKKKPDEAKILALIESFSHPWDTANLAKQQAALLSASNSDDDNTPGDINASQANEDADMEEYDAVDTILSVLDSVYTGGEAANGRVDEEMSH